MATENKLFAEMREFFMQAEKHFARHIEHRQKCRAALYMAAVRVRELHKKHSQWFMEQLREAGGADAFYEKFFAPLATFGEDWRKLLADVHNGITRKQYLASTAGTYTRKQKVASLDRRIESLSIARVHSVVLTDEEKAARYGDLMKTIHELQKALHAEQQRTAELERIINRVEKTLRVATA